MKRLLLILVAFALLPAAACSLRQKPTGENYYAQGQLDFATREYKAAIENYQQLIDKFPFSPYAEDAEMKIGLAHYQQKPRARHLLHRAELLRSDWARGPGSRQDRGGAQALPGVGTALSGRRLRRTGAREGPGMPRDART